MKKLALASLLALLAGTASAQYYGEIGYTSLDLDVDVGPTLTSSPDAVRGIFGYEFNPNLAFEGMLAVGLSDDGVKVNGTSVNASAEVRHLFGFYVKPKYKFTPQFEVFGRAGFSKGKAKISGAGGSASESESGLSFGVGASYAINQTVSVNFDYMSYLDESDVSVDGFTLGLGYKF